MVQSEVYRLMISISTVDHRHLAHPTESVVPTSSAFALTSVDVQPTSESSPRNNEVKREQREQTCLMSLRFFPIQWGVGFCTLAQKVR